ncbi:MAG: hypothetical protein NXI31_09545 [bacterium]|nr:hypothetical protein [bacterium]
MTESGLTPHEQSLLTDYMAGDRSTNDPEMAAAAANNPRFRAELEELQSVQHLLESDAERERDLLAAGGQEDSGVADDLVARTIRQLAGGPRGVVAGDSPGRRPFRGWLALSATVAAALLLVWGLGGFGGIDPAPPNDDDQQLGDERLQLVAPSLGRQQVVFTWSCAIPATSYTVTIYDPTDASELIESDELETTEWQLERARYDDLPTGVRWRVKARIAGQSFERSARLR